MILQRISADCSIYQVMDKFDSHHLWIQLLKDFQYLLFAGSLHVCISVIDGMIIVTLSGQLLVALMIACSLSQYVARLCCCVVQ